MTGRLNLTVVDKVSITANKITEMFNAINLGYMLTLKGQIHGNNPFTKTQNFTFTSIKQDITIFRELLTSQ